MIQVARHFQPGKRKCQVAFHLFVVKFNSIHLIASSQIFRLIQRRNSLTFILSLIFDKCHFIFLIRHVNSQVKPCNLRKAEVRHQLWVFLPKIFVVSKGIWIESDESRIPILFFRIILAKSHFQYLSVSKFTLKKVPPPH